MFSRLWQQAGRSRSRAFLGVSAAVGTGTLASVTPRFCAAEEGKTYDGWTVTAADLKNLAVAILKKAGSNAQEAEIVADNLVESNLKGHDSHGVGYMTRYIPGVQSGLIKINTHAKVITDEGPILHVDGDLGFGQVMGKEAMEKGIAKCKEHGVAIIGLKNSHHIARVGKWAEMACEEGFAGVFFTNVAGHDPLVAPFLGTDARLGTNPYTMGFPGPDKSSPVILDYATSEVALGKVREAMTAGKPMRPGVLLDKHGKPTTDSKCLPPDNGCILPFGSEATGYKGYALAMMCELYGGVLTGGFTIEPSYFRSDKIIANSMTAIIIDPAKFGITPAMLQKETKKLFEYVTASPSSVDGVPVEVPGYQELRYFKTRSAEGIPFTQGSYDAMVANAVKVGMTAAEAKKLLGGTPAKLYEDRCSRMSVVKA